ncbi:MAG TPA: autotransporter outer membrane beta-barrel domain-containing protein [Legionella sp.]|nr:autotransporter outer membrane beta-barrel domain-containing protein [Legionella sp.]
MKIQSITLLLCLTLNGFIAHAGNTPSTELTKEGEKVAPQKSTLKQIMPEFLYSYIDFDFDSTEGGNFNRFQGHSNVYSVGADHIILTPSIMAGLYVFKVDSDVNSQFFLAPESDNYSTQSIRNNTLFGHVRKSFTPNFDIDLGYGYGQNKIASQTLFFPNRVNQVMGYTSHRTTNWFGSLNGFYKTSWDKWMLRANLGLLYSRINAGRYYLNLPALQTAQLIAPLTNKATYVFEGAELSYQLTPQFIPFINGGLIQVAGFSNSRPLVTPLFNGSLPQLNLDQNGYRVGGGITYLYKQLVLRLEQKYYNAGNNYKSNQTIVGLEYHFS